MPAILHVDLNAKQSLRHAARGDAGSLTPSTLRELVTLCHPDRHPPERYDQANRATALLLGLMDR